MVTLLFFHLNSLEYGRETYSSQVESLARALLGLQVILRSQPHPLTGGKVLAPSSEYPKAH